MHAVPDEILVVDNSVGDKQTEDVARSFAARYVVEPKSGLSRARNRGLAESTSDIVAFIDDDSVPTQNWLELILQPFEDPQVAAVTGRVVTPESKPVDCTPRIVSRASPHWFEMATYGGLGRGSNMSFRKSSCAGLTAFDERLGRGAPFQIAEENYAFASLLSRGFTAVYLPSATVMHPSRRYWPTEEKARNSFGYWLLLFSEFPERRKDLLHFLIRRLRREPLAWPRESPDPGEIITSGWWMQMKAGISALLLFLRTRRPKRDER